MSVVRPHWAINAAVGVPPSSLLHATEYSMIECPGVVAGCTWCQAISGVSVWLFCRGRPRDASVRPYSTGAYLAATYAGLLGRTVRKPRSRSRAIPASLGEGPAA